MRDGALVGITEIAALSEDDRLTNIGEHASSQDEPRLGLGNVTRLLLGDDAHIGDFGAFLGEIDGIPETSCP